MRHAHWLRLIVLGALISGTSAPTALAQIRPPAKPVYTEKFTGYGLTVKDAEASALEQACDWLAKPERLGWAPTPEYLREKNMVRVTERGEQEFKVAQDFAQGGRMQKVTMQLDVYAEQARDIQKQARQARIPMRHLLLARVLGGLVALLIVVGGYLRLEEATKGYCTRLLRIAAVGIVVLILLAVIA